MLRGKSAELLRQSEKRDAATAPKANWIAKPTESPGARKAERRLPEE
jgi:hypothetical protein